VTDRPRNRQELYDLLRSTSSEEFILEEMIRLGFWHESSSPTNPANEIRRQAELQNQLRSLLTESRRLEDLDRMKKALRKQRMEESRRKQKENKERRESERQERALRWQRRRETEIVYLGEQVSGGLSDQQSNGDALARNDLAVGAFSTLTDLAGAMGVSLGELRFLAFNRRTSLTTHYQRFQIPKKSGGLRLISAPMPRMKRAQQWILRNVLDRIPLHDAAHGFRQDRSIVTNARPHVGAAVVINVDLRDFFPSVTYPRVKGMFKKLGLSEAISTVFALICSEPEVEEVLLDGASYYTATSERRLPQGAPSSPAITNILCRGLDARLSHAARQLGFTYTRYADDITFSSSDREANVGRALRRIRHIVTAEGFETHPDKTRVLRRGSRMEVTGLTVNDQLGVSRALLRRFKATLFQIQKDGPNGKQWGHGSSLMSSLVGFANFVAMVDPQKGRPLQTQVDAIIQQHGRGGGTRIQRDRWQAPAPPAGPEIIDAESAEPAPPNPRRPGQSRPSDPPRNPPSDPHKPWWKIW